MRARRLFKFEFSFTYSTKKINGKFYVYVTLFANIFQF